MGRCSVCSGSRGDSGSAPCRGSDFMPGRSDHQRCGHQSSGAGSGSLFLSAGIRRGDHVLSGGKQAAQDDEQRRGRDDGQSECGCDGTGGAFVCDGDVVCAVSHKMGAAGAGSGRKSCCCGYTGYQCV